MTIAGETLRREHLTCAAMLATIDERDSEQLDAPHAEPMSCVNVLDQGPPRGIRGSMSQRIRALCTRRLDALTGEDLHAGICSRLPTLAAYYGETGHEAVLACLRVETLPDHRGWNVYSQTDELRRPLFAEPFTHAGDVRAEAEARLAALIDCDDDGVEDVRELLGHLVEVVLFDMTDDRIAGMGWPLAIAVAATLVEHGDGVIQADGEGWLELDGLGIDQAIDAD